VITDTPPAKGAPAGTVAQGTIGPTHWRAGVQRDTTSKDTCLTADIGTPGAAASTIPLFCGVTGEDPTVPAGFTSAGEGQTQVQLGTVAPNVTYFTLTFVDGQQLKLIPVRTLGHRYVAFAAPMNMPIAGLTAHLGSAHFDSGQTATAIPFWLPGRVPVFGAWLRQGQPVPRRLTARLGTGTVDGKPWQATAYQGPWGTCVVFDSGSSCFAGTMSGTGVNGWGDSPFVAYGHAAADVAYLEFTMSDGTVLPRVTPVTVGGVRLFAFAAPGNLPPHRWAAFSASGAQLATGALSGSS
jgi:hypothetical protein